jgi:hypothetical protein
MNGWTKEIADILDCGPETAARVFDEMCASGFDFSESSSKALKREALIALQVIEFLED